MDVIIGAGITGLTYAAFTKNDYTIFEAESETGGYCRTIKKDGFIWDYSGHFFHFQDKKIKDYVFENISSDTIIDVVKSTQVNHHGKMVDFPFQKNIHQLSKEELIDCLYDLFVNRNADMSSFKNMLYAKFGRTIAEMFLIPYNEKLYACDLNTLDVDAMGRFFPYADKEEIIANFKTSLNKSYNASFVYPKGGAEEYVKSILTHVESSKINLNERLLGVDMENNIVITNKREIHYDNLISTIPFPELLSLCRVEFDRSLYTSNQVLVFNLGFDAAGKGRNHWEYFADKDLVFYRVGYYNNIFGSDRLSLYVEIGLPSDAAVDKDEYLKRVLADLKRVGIIDSHRLVSYSSVVMNPAYVHVTKHMEEDKAVKMEFLAQNHIYSIGRYGAWYYCSIEDNMKEAIDLANNLQ